MPFKRLCHAVHEYFATITSDQRSQIRLIFKTVKLNNKLLSQQFQTLKLPLKIAGVLKEKAVQIRMILYKIIDIGFDLLVSGNCSQIGRVQKRRIDRIPLFRRRAKQFRILVPLGADHDIQNFLETYCLFDEGILQLRSDFRFHEIVFVVKIKNLFLNCQTHHVSVRIYSNRSP